MAEAPNFSPYGENDSGSMQDPYVENPFDGVSPIDEARDAGLPAVVGYLEHCEKNGEYAVSDEARRAQLRPLLAQDFITSVGRLNNPDIASVFDDATVKQHVTDFQAEWGAENPRDPRRRQVRQAVQHQYMQMVGGVSDRDIRLRDTYHLAGEVYDFGDPALMDSIDTLLYAYGRTLQGLLKAAQQSPPK